MSRKQWVLVVAAIIVLGMVGWLGFDRWQDYLTVQEQQRQQTQSHSKSVEMQARINRSAQLADFQTLASAEMAGRGPGQAGHQQAIAYLQQRLAALDLSPLKTTSDTKQQFLAPYLTGTNVLAKIDGTDNAATAIVLTAHYDHLGMVGDKTYLGADDNASGVAAVLAIADYVKHRPLRHTLIIALVDEEERGLVGARALFSEQQLVNSDAKPFQVAFNINIDMLSRNTDNQLFVVGSWAYPTFAGILSQVQQTTPIHLIQGNDRPWYIAGRTPDWRDDSDHGVFAEQGIPNWYFGVPDHADYHQPTDSADKADLDFYIAATETVLSALLGLDGRLAELSN